MKMGIFSSRNIIAFSNVKQTFVEFTGILFGLAAFVASAATA